MESLINAEELSRQLAAAQDRVTQLDDKLADAKLRLQALRNISQSVNILNESPNGSSSESGRKFIEAAIRQMENMRSGRGEHQPQRIQSTRMVADLVNSDHKPWTRQEIHEGFTEKIGIPESWGNPVNALNNAIARAVEKGWIEESGNYFIPKGMIEQSARSQGVDLS